MKLKLFAFSAVLVTLSANAQFLIENVRSGIPSWDKAFINAGGKFDEPTPIFLGENVRSGIPSWDKAFINAGGKFKSADSKVK